MKKIKKTIALPDKEVWWIEEQVLANNFADDDEYILDLIRQEQERQNVALMEKQDNVHESLRSGESDKSLHKIWTEVELRYTRTKDSSNICFTHIVVDFLSEYIDYMIDAHGFKKARQYVDELKNCLLEIVQNPKLGKSAEILAPELKRINCKHQIVFYLSRPTDILVVDICHHEMGFGQHLLDSLPNT